jgi:hypothetical protein
MSCATALLNPFKDFDLSDGAVRTFGLLCELDRGPRGCFAHRETLARLRRLSVSAINHQIAELKNRGYVTVTRKGQKLGESGIIRVSDIARNALLALLPNDASLQKSASSNLQQDASLQKSASSNLQSDASLQKSANSLHVLEYCLNSTVTTTDSGEGTQRAEVKNDGAVVVSPDSVENLSEKPETNPNETVIHDLVNAGVDETHARQLLGAYPEARCRAAMAYVRDKGQGVKNSGGYIRFLLETNASIPKRYFQQPECKKPSVSQLAPKPAPVPAQPNPARLQRKTTSPHHQLLGESLHTDQPLSLIRRVPTVEFGPSLSLERERPSRGLLRVAR